MAGECGAATGPGMSNRLWEARISYNFDLWCKFFLLEEQVSEREFNEMVYRRKARYSSGMRSPRIHAFPRRRRPTAAVTPRV